MFSAIFTFLFIFCALGFLLYQIVAQENIFNKICIFLLELILIYILSRFLEVSIL